MKIRKRSVGLAEVDREECVEDRGYEDGAAGMRFELRLMSVEFGGVSSAERSPCPRPVASPNWIASSTSGFLPAI